MHGDASLSLFKCDECAFVTRAEEKVEEHKVIKHINEVIVKTDASIFMHSCVSCDFNTNDYQIIRKHIDETHRQQTIIKDVARTEYQQEFLCETCGKSFPTIVELKLHEETEHVEETGANTETCIKCRICKLEFSSGSNLNEHLGSHRPNVLVQCDQCEEVCDDVSNFISHLQNTHRKNTEVVECKHCDFKAINKDSLYEHLECEHIEYAMLASVTAGQANMISSFEQFKGELCDVINKIINGQNKIIDDQNIIKQELFILKNQKKDAPVNINKMEESVAKLTTSVNNLSKYSQKVEDISPCPPCPPEKPS